MTKYIITIYCFCDDYLKSIKHEDWDNCKLSTAEIMTILLVGTRFFAGNLENTRQMLKEQNYIPYLLSKSALNRRIHQIPELYWQELMLFIYSKYKAWNLSNEFVVDTFPIKSCHNIRIMNSRIYQGNHHRGYNASKREYFYGIKVCLLTSIDGFPIEVLFAPARTHDLEIFKEFEINLPPESCIYSDSAFLDYNYENTLAARKIKLIAERKSNSKKSLNISDLFNLKSLRRNIENVFSRITSLFPKKIHAVTSRGFEIKIFCFILAYTFNLIMT